MIGLWAVALARPREAELVTAEAVATLPFLNSTLPQPPPAQCRRLDRRYSRFRHGVRRPFDSEVGSDLYDDIDEHPIRPRASAHSAPGSL